MDYRFRFSLVLSLAALFFSCKQQFLYHFPKENELKGYQLDSLKWRYTTTTVVQVPVANSDGKLYWREAM